MRISLPFPVKHQINVERLKEVLEFYKAFAQTFSKNLTLTYDLARRTVISRVSDRKMERVLNEVHQPFTPAQVWTVGPREIKGCVTPHLIGSWRYKRKDIFMKVEEGLLWRL